MVNNMEKKKTKKHFKVGMLIKSILLVIVLCIFMVAGIILFKANTNPDAVPDVFGYKPMIVLSGSMETSIYAGDLVFVKVVDTSTLKENDVIAFRNEANTVTTHRIIDIVYEEGQKYFKTKGDNNNAEDANLVAMDDVEGVYSWRIPGLGNFLMFMQQPIGLALVLLVILVIGLAVLYIVNKKDEKKYRAEDEKERREFEEYKRMKEQQRINQDKQ